MLLVSGCMSPGIHVDRLARAGLLQREIVTGAPFRHVTYRPQTPRPGAELHVYIEGDGKPYLTPYMVAPDPTSNLALALELMLQDPAPTLFLGRPCYLGLARDPQCSPPYWTFKRFSIEVVQSLVTVLQLELERLGPRRLTLIGHSGGAALALLIADRVSAVERVVTVAGNMDIADWARLHQYAPLSGSVDPMTSGRHRSDLVLLHLAGSSDHNVPSNLVQAAAAKIGGRVVIVPHFDHECCWVRIWPDLLRQNFDPTAAID